MQPITSRRLATALFTLSSLGVGIAVDAGARPASAASTTLSITGRGNGHGIGLSQYGALGYAENSGWTAEQILSHYYGGTVAGTVAPGPITVRLNEIDDAQTAIVSLVGSATLVGDPEQRTWRSMVAREVAPRQYRVWGRTDRVECAPATLDLSDPVTGWIEVTPAPQATVDFDPAVVAVESPTVDDLIGVCRPNGTIGHYRGSIRAANGTDGENRTINVVNLELYLRSVVGAEVPASWGAVGGGKGQQALIAQAVAARSYAATQNRYSYARTCSTQTCQVYRGAGERTSPTGTFRSFEFNATTAAVGSSAGLVRRVGSAAGPVANTMFSSSSGGHTAPTVSPGFPAVADLGDATSRNPYRSWTVAPLITTVESKWPQIGRLASIAVTRRNGLGADGGRVLEMVLSGSAGQVTITGDQFRVGMGLRSNWFSIVSLCNGRDAHAVKSTVAPLASGSFVPVSPTRVVDTSAGPTPMPLGAGCTLTVPVAPPTGTLAGVFQITVTGSASTGGMRFFPCGTSRAVGVGVIAKAGGAASTQAVVPMGTGAKLCVYSPFGAHIAVDHTGWITSGPGRGLRSIPPRRLIDSRQRVGIRPAGSVSVVALPDAPAGAMASVNVTAVGAATAGHLTAFPCGSTRPAITTLRTTPGSASAAHTWVGLSSTKTLCIYSSVATHLIVDLDGWLVPGGSSVPVGPFRRPVNTAAGVGATRLVAGTVTPIVVAAPNKVVIATVSVIGPASRGYLWAGPCAASATTSSVSVDGAGSSNLVTLTASPDGTICLRSSMAADVMIDVWG